MGRLSSQDFSGFVTGTCAVLRIGLSVKTSSLLFILNILTESSAQWISPLEGSLEQEPWVDNKLKSVLSR